MSHGATEPVALLGRPLRASFDTVLRLLVLTAVYFAAGKLGLTLAFVNASASAVWPPTGIALAAVLWLGPRVWPAVFLGAFLVNVTTTPSIVSSLGIAAGNSLEALVGAYLVGRFAGGRDAFLRARDVFRFGAAVLVSTTVSATIGTTSLAAGGYAAWQDYGPIWFTWWLGDVSGALVVTPLVLLWGEGSRVEWRGRQVLEAGSLFLATVAIAGVVFFGIPPTLARNLPITFLCLPPLVWVAFRFGRREAVTLAAVLSALAIRGTLRGFGPFAPFGPNESLLPLQAFMATVTLTTLSVAALVRERLLAEREQRELRAEAEAERARLEAVVQHMPVGVIIAEAPSGRVILSNARVERIWRHAFDLSPSIEAYRAYRGFHRDGRPYEPTEWPLARSITAGEVVLDEEIDFVRGDGTRGTMSVNSAPLRDPAGRIVAGVVIFDDVSARKELETQRAELLALERNARAQAEAANQAKDEFLTTLSHELRNPLGAITSAAQVLTRGDRPDEPGRRASEVIARQARHLTRMVDDLLDVAQVTVGRIHLRPEPVDLAQAAARSIDALREAGQLGRHELALELESAWVDADPVRLEQVITNLLTNALRYTAAGGRIRVAVDQLAGRARLEVQDTGVGIASDMLGHIFESFVRSGRPADGSERRPRARPGPRPPAGRAPRRRDHGLQQRPRDGEHLHRAAAGHLARAGPESDFRDAGSDPPHACARGRGPRGRTADAPAGARAVGTRGAVAGDGPSGVEAACRLRPDLALVDLGLPGFDGYEVARRIRQDPAGARIRLVALTGYGQAGDRARTAAAGFDAHLTKPFDPGRLAEVLAMRRGTSRTS